MNVLQLIGRERLLFDTDLAREEKRLTELVKGSRFLVIGGAGSIGQAVTREIFKRRPRVLHVVDISENNMVELVRDIRSTLGYIDGDFRTFAIDCGGREFDALMNAGDGYDYVLNLSALKHVRSEKDPFTLMRLIEVNVLNTLATIAQARSKGARKYFCVSTDKAANPVNMMGASKRIMEMFLMRESLSLPISTARFANVAFSDGSLLHGFNQRFAKRQPISAPNDVRRYFVTPQESGELCLMSCLLGDNRDIFFPKLSEALHLTRFSDIAVRYLESLGYEPHECGSEDEARERAGELIAQRKWPVYFFASDTTGEKDFEEFFTERETLDMARFDTVGVIKNAAEFDGARLDGFVARIEAIRAQLTWDKAEIVALFNEMIPDFDHKETGRYLDNRM
ncbi:UDP-N-acetylglucosamine 4,6-dehydratase [Aromatoleum bremense]|uniref:NAD-dependent epimerase/dehydratase family protein n=1 Tax=Aromatoleum bremense TaxID=76115 RepID=A0ABX1NYQ7_9RHOO|nr:UDP-N-acetylglucosamine 4,6-dehydratase [Aromatoleum bremense]NMG16640.1 NAD-dependent epimerase/dehydratase family protein [Aromatoleum bremense]QTQ33527.1 Putative polysaccharide biosynthesis protein [Aromatoleum bremense]